MKKLFFILFISLFIFSCDDDDNPVGPIDDIENYVYPIQLNNNWVYDSEYILSNPIIKSNSSNVSTSNMFELWNFITLLNDNFLYLSDKSMFTSATSELWSVF